MQIGVLGIQSFRPFPLAAVRAALQGAQRVVVLEKSFSVGLGGIVSTDVRLALSGLQLHGYTVIAGLGGRAITKASLARMLARSGRRPAASRSPSSTSTGASSIASSSARRRCGAAARSPRTCCATSAPSPRR